MKSGIRLPYVSCGFRGCGWVRDVPPSYHWDMETAMYSHLAKHHRHREMSSDAAWSGEGVPEKSTRSEIGYPGETRMEALAYYMAACEIKEQEGLPVIGVSQDRRMLAIMANVVNSSTVRSLVCFACPFFCFAYRQ